MAVDLVEVKEAAARSQFQRGEGGVRLETPVISSHTLSTGVHLLKQHITSVLTVVWDKEILLLGK